MPSVSEWFVYWLFDASCRDKHKHGCIGATKATRIWMRINQHKNSARIPQPFQYTIIFRGSRKEALAFEAKLRPRPYIGWNVGVGGFSDGGGLKGIQRSPEVREKIRAAALRRWANPVFRAKQLKLLKRTTFGQYDRSGANNPNFGKATSEATKQKMRDKIAERGILGKKNPNYRHGEYCQ
jgi:hypothetical protein